MNPDLYDAVPLSFMMINQRAASETVKQLCVRPNAVVEVFYADMQRWYRGYVINATCGNQTFTIKFDEDGEESRFYYAGRNAVTWRHAKVDAPDTAQSGDDSIETKNRNDKGGDNVDLELEDEAEAPISTSTSSTSSDKKRKQLEEENEEDKYIEEI